MARAGGRGNTVATVVMILGIIFIVAGGVTWFVVRDQLGAQDITVSKDADHFAGDKVNDPLTAYAQAQVISKHALEATGGKTYAQLSQDDPNRATAMQASFLQASLYTSVVAFGVAFMAVGVGVTFILIAMGLRSRAAPPSTAGTV
jgi:hypothetical protein